MTQKQKLEFIIQKAVNAGLDFYPEYDLKNKIAIFCDVPERYLLNHDFAKALFGKGTHKIEATYYGKPVGKLSWQYHLQQAVISEDPINYIYEQVKEK